MSVASSTDKPVKVPKAKPTQKNLRNVELVLLFFAFLISFGALALVQLGQLETLEQQPFILGGIAAAAVLAFHIFLRFFAPKADPLILPVTTLINAIGLIMIYRIDFSYAAGSEYQQRLVVGANQLIYTVFALAIAIATIVVIRNHRVLQRYTYTFMLVAIIFLLLPLIPGLGIDGTNAKIWIQLFGFSFQPAEVAKIALAIFFAGYLTKHRDSLAVVGKKFAGMTFPRGRDLGPILMIWLLSMAVLVFQRDLGTSLLYFGLFLVMIYVATGRTSWIVIGGSLFLAGAFIASRTMSYVQFRVKAWLDPFDQELYDATGGSYQLVQGLFGQAAGGLTGTGLGRGRPAITQLANSDFIYASLAEELGLIGIFALLALYLVLIGRGLRIGMAGQDDFGKLLATGFAFVLALQCFIVIGGVTKVIPLTGLTLPFLAAGGSSLLANWLIIALLLRISDSVNSQPRAVVGT